MKIRKRILAVTSAMLISLSTVYPVNINGQTVLSEQVENEEKTVSDEENIEEQNFNSNAVSEKKSEESEQQPTVTETPMPTEAPVITETPIPTEAPVATGTPEQTESANGDQNVEESGLESEEIGENADIVEEVSPETDEENVGTEEKQTTSNIDIVAVENVKTLFTAILKEYFPNIQQYDLSSEEAENTIKSGINDMEPEILDACYTKVTEAINAINDLGDEETDYFVSSEPGLYHIVAEVLMEALNEKTTGGIAPMSLLPLEEVKAALVYTDAIKTIDDVLDNLQDSNGNKIEIAANATTAWKYIKDSADGVETYEEYELGIGKQIDLSVNADVSSYLLELIVGSGAQLDPGNIRYLITIYITDEVEEQLNFELYTEDENGVRSKAVPARKEEAYNDDLSDIMPIDTMKVVTYVIPEHTADSEYYLGISSLAAKHPERTVDVYTYPEYMLYLAGAGGSPITDKILNQNMTASGSGYKGNFSIPTTIMDAFNENFGFFIIVEKDLAGNTVRTTPLTFAIASGVNDISYVDNEFFTIGDSGIQNVVCVQADSIDIDDLYIDMNSGEAGGSGIHEYFYMLNEGYSADSEFYCAFKAYGETYGDKANSYVIKAVVGLYDSLDQVGDLEDIKSQLFPVNSESESYGYKANYNYADGGVYFTAFFEDGTVLKFNVKAMDYNPKYDENYVKQYTEAPVIGEADPWFRVAGVKDTSGEMLPAYVVENGKNNNIDTAYGYGYQTVLINSSETTVVPILDCANSDTVKIAQIFIEGQPYVEGQPIELDKDEAETKIIFNVEITDQNGKHTKNYPVSFVRKSSGPKLFVVEPKGDSTRSVFLTQYFESKHDILIANVGDEPLEDIHVVLDAKHCKLDNYWTVGGENNSTLAPFEAVSSDSEYGELANLAKIRLLPDGEGEIEGTLTIYAKDQTPVVIHLSGRAVNPEITTVELKKAVRWVPYSYMVTTDNMYDWNSLKFSVVSGSLPQGLELDENTGEIYGVPQVEGGYHFTIQADYSHEEFEPSRKEFTINVADNDDETVFFSSDDGFSIIPEENGENGYLGEQVSAYDFVLTSLDEDEVFISEGNYGEFVKLWLNGQLLEEGTDYTSEEGSTRITIKAQTLKDKTNDGRNTISAEYNENGKRGENLKRTSQNFRVDLKTEEPENPKPTEKPVQPDPTKEPDQPGNPTPTKKPEQTGNLNSSPKPQLSITGTPSVQPETTEIPDGTDKTEPTATAAAEDKRAGQEAVICIINVVDGEDQPVADLPIELHSDPQTAATDTDGMARFSGVEFGQHTVYVKNQQDEIDASRSFEIRKGSGISLDGDVITAGAGDTVTIKMRYEKGELTLLSAAGRKAVTPKTGDETMIAFWCLCLALSTSTYILICRRKKKQIKR